DEQVTGTLVAFGDQAGAAQDAQVKRDGLLGHGDLFGNLADGAGPIADQRQDAAAVTVGERAQRRVHRFVNLGGGRASPHDTLFKLTLVQMSTSSSAVGWRRWRARAAPVA